MSYKEEFTSNNTDLQTILDMVNALPEADSGTDAEDWLITRTISGEYSNDRVTIIGSGAFMGCSNLISVNFPVASYIGTHAFAMCSNLTTVNAPAVGHIGMVAFSGCSSLTSVNFPAASEADNQVFANCIALADVNLPILRYIGISTFSGCSSLTGVNFPAATNIGSNAFRNCYNLVALTLGNKRVCNLYNSNAFSSTPIGGYLDVTGQYGSIYVPASLLTSYRTATNWSYYSSRFVGINEEGKIKFTIDNLGTHYVYPGTTWGEFIETCVTDFELTYHTETGGVIIGVGDLVDGEGNQCNIADVIVPNATYYDSSVMIPDPN